MFIRTRVNTVLVKSFCTFKVPFFSTEEKLSFFHWKIFDWGTGKFT
jgi:hypothetical protein